MRVARSLTSSRLAGRVRTSPVFHMLRIGRRTTQGQAEIHLSPIVRPPERLSSVRAIGHSTDSRRDRRMGRNGHAEARGFAQLFSVVGILSRGRRKRARDFFAGVSYCASNARRPRFPGRSQTEAPDPPLERPAAEGARGGKVPRAPGGRIARLSGPTRGCRPPSTRTGAGRRRRSRERSRDSPGGRAPTRRCSPTIRESAGADG